MRPSRGTAFPVCGLIAATLLAACAGGPRQLPENRPGTVAARIAAPSLGERISASALALVGHPYRYGGNGPDAFDCSGLVRYAYAEQGIQVPRTTSAQYAAARPVQDRELSPGDVLFFRFDGPKVSHVAIYIGNGRFVHAPKSGRAVEARQLDEPWYRHQLVSAGRLY